MATYAIGDVQGCFDRLLALLDACRFDPLDDRLWLTGDLVNRGPDSLATLRFVRSLGAPATTVLGNHDLHFLAVAAGVRQPGPGDTLDDLLAAPDRDKLIDWLRARPLLHREDRHLLVHAGLLPQWTADEALALAGEVEARLRGPDWRAFLGELFGPGSDRWTPEAGGVARLRVIVNAMTRVRFITPDGVMDFKAKGEAHDAPPGHLPWFRAPGRRTADDLVVFGHWSALGVVSEPNLLALDSGCTWGRALTAARLEDRRLFSVPCEKCSAFD